MHAPLTLLSPAKLNLFLHITGRRPDGYHELQTIFQLLDWGDELTFEAADNGEITLEGDTTGIVPKDNLILRAAQLLEIEGRGLHIHLKKRIPMGGGLGGGSSNAATTLLAINHLFGLGYSGEELCLRGAQLGADVPVFVAGATAWAEGVGEQLTPIELSEQWFLIVVPPCHVSTAEVFSDDQLTRNSSPIKMAAFLQGDSRNDCQNLVRKRYPEVDNALIFLEKYWEPRMTGTGACLFVTFPDEEQASAARERLPDHWQSYIARGINHSPTQALLN